MQRDYIIPPSLKLKQKAIFNFDELYKAMFRWFELYHYDFHEREYRDSVEPSGKHIEVRWYAEKKIDDYVKFAIEFDYLILGLQDIVIEREDGRKTKTNKGEVTIRITTYLLKDSENKWNKGPMIRFMRAVYDRFIIRTRLEGYEFELYNEIHKLIAEAKAFLALHKI